MMGHLDWSQSASRRRYGFGAKDEGYLRMRWQRLQNEFPKAVYSCYWTRVAILTWSNFDYYICSSSFLLVRACRRGVRKQSQLGEVFLSSSLQLHTDNYPEYLHAFIADLWGWRRVHTSNCQLSFSCNRNRFESLHHYDRRFGSQCRNGIMVMVSFSSRWLV